MTSDKIPLGEYAFFQPGWADSSFPTLEEPAPTPPAAVEDPQQPMVAPLHRAAAAGVRRGAFGPPPPYVEEEWDRSDLDWALIKELRIKATNEITERRSAQMSKAEEEALGRRVIAELVQRLIAEQMQRGEAPAIDQTDRIQRAVFDALFGMGRLQPLLDSQWIENIEIHGAHRVHVELIDGTLCDGPPIADSDDELVEDLQFWASRSAEARSFSAAKPVLDLPLGETARLAAMSWVTGQPVVTIRVHGMVQATFEDLIAKGTITPLMANFLSAVVISGASIVVSGAQGAGKTTLCRALCAALPPSERIITFETDRELHLDKMPDKHPRVFAVEARQGSGEWLPNGREAGSFDIGQGLRAALRHNADRLLVGEVRGGEIIAMLQAMQSGTGSISTTHARSARDTYQKLVTCCLEVPGQSEAFATRAIASAINFVVYIEKVNIDGRRVRRVTEIVALGLDSDGVNFTDVFTRDDPTQHAKANVLPPHLAELLDAGFDQDAFLREAQQRPPA